MTTVKSMEDDGMSLKGELRWNKLVIVPAALSAYINAQSSYKKGSIRVEIESSGKAESSESSGDYCVASSSRNADGFVSQNYSTRPGSPHRIELSSCRILCSGRLSNFYTRARVQPICSA